jgi:hypothetical protein
MPHLLAMVCDHRRDSLLHYLAQLLHQISSTDTSSSQLTSSQRLRHRTILPWGLPAAATRLPTRRRHLLAHATAAGAAQHAARPWGRRPLVVCPMLSLLCMLCCGRGWPPASHAAAGRPHLPLQQRHQLSGVWA